MKAVVITDFGAEPKLADLPVPEPGPGELLVRMHAAALNPFDWKVAGGALKGVVSHAFPTSWVPMAPESSNASART